MGTSGRFVAIHSHHHSHPWSNSYWPRKDAQCSSSCPFQPISSPVILQSPATTREDEPSQAIVRQSCLPTLVASLQCSLRRVGLLDDDLSATFHPIRSLFTWSDIQSSPYIRLQLGHCSGRRAAAQRPNASSLQPSHLSVIHYLDASSMQVQQAQQAHQVA